MCAALDKRTVLWWSLALVLPVLLFDPVRQTFLLGQVNIILALMIVADLTMDLPLPARHPGRAGGGHQGDARHPDPVPLPHPAGPGRRAGPSPRSPAPPLLAVAVNASTSWSYWTHYIRDPQRAGMLSWIGNQGVLGATERMLGHTVTTPTTFVIVLTVGVLGLAGRRRRLPPVVARPRAARGGGHRVAGQPGLVVAPLHLGGPSGGVARPGPGPAPLRRVVRAGRRRPAVGRAVLVGAARAGRPLRRAGLARCRSATPTRWSSWCCSSGRRSAWCAPRRCGRCASAGGRWRRPAPAPEGLGRQESAGRARRVRQPPAGRVRLADEEARVGTRVEPACGRRLRVRHPPARSRP